MGDIYTGNDIWVKMGSSTKKARLLTDCCRSIVTVFQSRAMMMLLGLMF